MVAISGLEQQVGADGAYILAFAYGLLLAVVYTSFFGYAEAYLKFGAEVKEYEAFVPTLLPLKLYGDAEEEVAQAAVAVVGSGGFTTFGLHLLSVLEVAASVLFQ